MSKDRIRDQIRELANHPEFNSLISIGRKEISTLVRLSGNNTGEMANLFAHKAAGIQQFLDKIADMEADEENG